VQRNTLVTISDNKIGVSSSNANLADFYEARVLSATDYYAFGMAMKERSWQSEKYRYGFNGKENDGDWEVQDYGFRIYKPELGRFLSVDPLSASYPWNSVYAFAENDVIRSVDLDGLEKLIVINSRTETLEFLRIKKEYGIKAAIAFAEFITNASWHDKADYIWLRDERAQIIDKDPLGRKRGAELPDFVAQSVNDNEVEKGIVVWGHFDYPTENTTYFRKIGEDLNDGKEPTPPDPDDSHWSAGVFVNPSAGASVHWGFIHISVVGAFEGTIFTGQENGKSASGLYMEMWGEAQYRNSFEEDGFDWKKFRMIPKFTWDYGMKQGVLIDPQGNMHNKGTGWLGGSYKKGEIETIMYPIFWTAN
jgi:RHS repeat-associated protein